MTQYKSMTLDEKLAIGVKAAELRKAGNIEESDRLTMMIPLPPICG